ncbi:MAG: hypothetical protein ABSF69_24595 [Polyangiaceae bacterium]
MVASPVSGGGAPLSSDGPPPVLVGVEAVEEGAVDVVAGGVVAAPAPVGIVPTLDPGVLEPVPELHAALSATGATTAKSAGPANR